MNLSFKTHAECVHHAFNKKLSIFFLFKNISKLKIRFTKNHKDTYSFLIQLVAKLFLIIHDTPMFNRSLSSQTDLKQYDMNLLVKLNTQFVQHWILYYEHNMAAYIFIIFTKHELFQCETCEGRWTLFPFHSYFQ